MAEIVAHSTETARAERVIARCRELALCTETPGETTRMFLCEAMRECHQQVRGWMEAAGMSVSVDHAGNIRGVWAAAKADAPRLLIASHLDTVPNAGAFDGVLGVMMGIALVEELGGQRLPFAIEVIGFSEEEGARFGVPFLGSRALVGELDDALLARTDEHGCSVGEAITTFGLNTSRIGEAELQETPLGYFEIHIEQGPVLEAEEQPLGVVESIAGQTRGEFTFVGEANHAGTTPMHLRKDALLAAAEWMLAVEAYARGVQGLVATTGRVTAEPGAVNVVAGAARVTLDVRHAKDAIRNEAIEAMVAAAQSVTSGRGVRAEWEKQSEQAAVPMDARLTTMLEMSVMAAGVPARVMVSGAGHDAMMVAPRMPTAMLFLRSPGGLSHHPDESVLPGDVEKALAAGVEFLHMLAEAQS
ncbi:MAG: allantoate amidohydrolase [Acidobacteriaceae bacterium]|nr:allantoate amidohydrolase [Acidobacteriaceae bacterium]